MAQSMYDGGLHRALLAQPIQCSHGTISGTMPRLPLGRSSARLRTTFTLSGEQQEGLRRVSNSIKHIKDIKFDQPFITLIFTSDSNIQEKIMASFHWRKNAVSWLNQHATRGHQPVKASKPGHPDTRDAQRRANPSFSSGRPR